MKLETLRAKFCSRLRTIESAFERHTCSPLVSRQSDRFALQEGLVSALWQSWVNYCRELLLASAKGAETDGGILTSSRYAAYQFDEIAYVAMQAANGSNITRIRSIPSRKEPTWGDLSKFLVIAQQLNPTNIGSIQQAYSSCDRLNDLQLCRNSSAHLSLDNIHAVRQARVRYQDTKFNHPSDLIHWVDPQTNDFVWRTWVNEAHTFAAQSTH